MEMEQNTETSAYKFQAPGNYPEESIKQYDLVKCDATWVGKFSPDVSKEPSAFLFQGQPVRAPFDNTQLSSLMWIRKTN